MTATYDEVLMGLGSGEISFDYYPDLATDLAKYNHLVLFRNGRPFGAVVILDRTPSSDGIIVAGLGLGWWLSVDNEGSIIEDAEFIAGNGQLSNGSFELLDGLGFPILWKADDVTGWVSTMTGVQSGARAMKVTGGLGKDDVLASTEPRPIRAGDLVEARANGIRLAGSEDRLRFRTVYEGRFAPPDLLESFDFDTDWFNDSEFPGDLTVIDADSVILGECTQPQIVVNPSFETGDLTGWEVAAGAGFAVLPGGTDGASCLSCIDLTGATNALVNYLPGHTQYPAVKGNRFRFEADGWAAAGTDGNFDVRMFAGASAPVSVIGGNGGSLGGAWQHKETEADVQADGALVVSVNVWGMSAGQYLFDRLLATRIKGNTVKFRCPTFAVTPGRSYHLFAPIEGSWPESGPTRNGTVHLLVKLHSSTGRADLPDVLLASTAVDVSQSANRFIVDHRFTPDSGYDVCEITIIGTDLYGGNVIAHRPMLNPEDTTTMVFDYVVGPDVADWTTFVKDTTAPAGAEKIYLQLIGENLKEDSEWHVDNVTWKRREATTDIPTIIDFLLRDTDTGEYLVTPGTIHPTGLPAWDWLLTNEPARDALIELLRGGRITPAQEFRHNPDNTIDIGTAEELFEVRPITFIDEDLLLLSAFDVKESVEDQLTREKLFGARLQRPPPLPDAVVTSTYETTIPGAVDWYGNPVRRTKIVEDDAVTFQEQADARTQSDVEASIAAADSLTVDISEWAAWGDLNVGDWCEAYKREALWEDRTNPKIDRRTGRTVFPRPSRVLGRTLTMADGDGFAVKVRLADGTMKDVSRFVRWADKTSARLELGDELVDLVNDPQGPAAGIRYARERAREARQ